MDEVVERLRRILPPERQHFARRQQWALAQFHYGDPRIHYEVWVRRGSGRVEVGLHFESDRRTNAELLAHFEEHVIPIKATLGATLWTPIATMAWTAFVVYGIATAVGKQLEHS